MTHGASQGMVADPQLLTQRLATFVRSKGDAKTLARTITCDVRTAENMRTGRHWPTARHWAGLLTAFGQDITEAVFHPDRAAARLEAEVLRLEQEIAAKRAALKDVGGHATRRPENLPRLDQRAAALTRDPHAHQHQ
jgi:hypothetical protein